MTATATATTFRDLCELEPRLRDLERRTVQRGYLAYRRRNWCANGAWYGYGRFDGAFSLKSQLTLLVGHYRRDPDPSGLLKTSAAYDVAYDHLYRLLPACRVCGCL